MMMMMMNYIFSPQIRPHHYIRSILPRGPVGVANVFWNGDQLLEVVLNHEDYNDNDDDDDGGDDGDGDDVDQLLEVVVNKDEAIFIDNMVMVALITFSRSAIYWTRDNYLRSIFLPV